MLVFSIFFSIGNWFQLRASQQRPLGYGERHHTFFDGFTVVLVYTLVFFAAAAGAVWLVSRYMMKQKITMRDAAAGVGSLLVPAVACSIAIEQATAGTKSDPTPAAASRIVIFCFII